MTQIDAKTVMALRKQTGAPMMECKAALTEAGGSMDKAADILRKKGLQSADSKSGRDVAEGTIFHYVHHNGKLGCLAEVACETDFVARNEEFQQFGKALCMSIAANNPKYLAQDEVDEAALAKEKAFLIEQARETMADKPDSVIEKAIEGRVKKYLAEICLMDQPWVMDSSMTVEDARKAIVGKIGENIQVRRFSRLELGG